MFCCSFSDKVFDHFINPRNSGAMEDADAVGEAGEPSCGDSLTLYIKVSDNVITDISFKVFGCVAAIASSSMTTVLAKGKTLEEALKITDSDIADALDGLPEEKLHCSVLGSSALKNAVESYKANFKESGYSVMEKVSANKKSCLQPAPKVLVSCRGQDGEDNVLAVGYCGNCSYAPPMVMVGIVPSRYSYKMIKESGCFVVNLVDKSYKEEFDYLGKNSKRDGDKLAKMNVMLEDAKVVNAPIMADCPVNIECTVVDSIVTGSHEMFIGRVEYVHADASLVDGEGNIDFSKISFIG